MNDTNELFELCKQVYEATGWKHTIGKFHDDGSYDGYVGHMGISYTPSPQDAKWLPKDIPLYTTDYLLEKLPDGTTIMKDVQGFKAWNIYNRKRISTYTCDSPVEALLKLTLKLHEEEIL